MVGGNSRSRMALPPLFGTEVSVSKSEAKAIGSEYLKIFLETKALASSFLGLKPPIPKSITI